MHPLIYGLNVQGQPGRAATVHPLLLWHLWLSSGPTAALWASLAALAAPWVSMVARLLLPPLLLCFPAITASLHPLLYGLYVLGQPGRAAIVHPLLLWHLWLSPGPTAALWASLAALAAPWVSMAARLPSLAAPRLLPEPPWLILCLSLADLCYLGLPVPGCSLGPWLLLGSQVAPGASVAALQGLPGCALGLPWLLSRASLATWYSTKASWYSTKAPWYSN